MVINKNFIVILFTAFILIIGICSVNALGVSYEYNFENPLIVSPGQTKDIQLTLQNRDQSKIEVKLLRGEEIASLIDRNPVYDVSPGKFVPVRVRIKIPKTMAEGKYTLGFLFLDVSPSEGTGTVSFKGSSQISLDVFVKEQNLTNNQQLSSSDEGFIVGSLDNIKIVWFLIIGVIIILISVIVYIIIKRR